MKTVTSTTWAIIIPTLLFLFSSFPPPLSPATEIEGNPPSKAASDGKTKGRVLPPRVESPGTGTFYCEDRIISTGLTMPEVAARCGEPAWRQRLHDGIVRDPLAYPEGIEAYVIDEWIYDFGPQRLLRFLRFREGRLVGIRTGGYGYGGPAAVAACGGGAGFRLGATKMEVFFECGPPAPLKRPGTTVPEDAAQQLAVESDEWTYDFGPERLTYHLVFQQGRLAYVRTGRYGER